MSTVDQRRTLRTEGRQARAALQHQPRQDAERRLTGHLGSLQLGSPRVAGVYLAHDGEPDLSDWIAQLRAGGWSVAVPVPASDADDFSMRFRRWDLDDSLTPGRYGILCPPSGDERWVIPELIFVPLVRFDPAGNRIGRGAGFYDRWLSDHPAHTIGVAFECQRCDALPVEQHDIALDTIVTDLGVRLIRQVALP